MSDALALATDGFLGDGGDALSLMSEGFLHETVVPAKKPKPKSKGGSPKVIPSPYWCPPAGPVPAQDPALQPSIRFELRNEHFRAAAAAMATSSASIETRIAAAFGLLGKNPDI